MLKFTVLICFTLVAMIYATKQSCYSCGQECAPSCGTRRYRACCFNYLRKKRGQESTEAIPNQEQVGVPVIFFKYDPEDWSNILETDSKLSLNGETAEKILITV